MRENAPTDAPQTKKRGKGPRSRPRGRPLDDAALAEVRALLGAMERRRDLLIEALHRLQDGVGHLAARHLKALAEEFRIPEAEVHEVASFYHHFDIVKEGEPAPAPLTIRVCDGVRLHDGRRRAAAGGAASRRRSRRDPGAGPCPASGAAPARRRCTSEREPSSAPRPRPRSRPPGPGRRSSRSRRTRSRSGPIAPTAAIGSSTNACRARAMRRASSPRSPTPGLRGLGGAGFPAGRKWAIVRSYPGPRLMSVNADEGEPGTFKDRFHLERDPHRFLEGALVAAWAVEAERLFIYLRDEYARRARALRARGGRDQGGGLLDRHAADRALAWPLAPTSAGEEKRQCFESIEGKRRPCPVTARRNIRRKTGPVRPPDPSNHKVETLLGARHRRKEPELVQPGSGTRGHKGSRRYGVRPVPSPR